MSKFILLFWFGATILFPQQSTTWVPYSARYTEVVNETDGSGHVVTHTENSGEELRSSDGSLLVTIVLAGQRATGQLWQGCGQRIEIDYSEKKATFGSSIARKHPQPTPDAPEGTMNLDNVEFTAYPIHVVSQQGHGTVWVNMDLDIVAKLVTHLDLPNGAAMIRFVS